MTDIIDKTKPHGKIKFIHFRDGTEHTFWVATNSLTGSRLSAFDGNAPDIDQPMAYLKTVFRDIRNKATRVISYEGSKHFT
jgi:hypothetical protein